MHCAQLVLSVRFERDGFYVLRVYASAESARPSTLVFSCVFLVRLRLSLLCVSVNASQARLTHSSMSSSSTLLAHRRVRVKVRT